MSRRRQNQRLRWERHCAQHPRQELDTHSDQESSGSDTLCPDLAEGLLSRIGHVHIQSPTVGKRRQKQPSDMVQAATENMTKHARHELHMSSDEESSDSDTLWFEGTKCLRAGKQHVYREMSTERKRCQKQLSDMVLAATGHMTKLREQQGKLETSQNNIRRDISNARKELRQEAGKSRNVVSTAEKSLARQLHDSQETALASVRAALQKIENDRQKLLDGMEALELRRNNLPQAELTSRLQKELKHQQEASLWEVSWTFSIEKGSSAVPRLRTVGMKSESVNCNTDLERLEPDGALRTLEPDIGDYVVGLVVLGDIVCATGFEQQYLWVKNTVANVSRRHEVRGLAAQGMTSLKNEGKGGTFTVVITDRNRKVHFITVDKSSLRITKQFAADIYWFCAISYHHKQGKRKTDNYQLVWRPDCILRCQPEDVK